VLRRAAVRGPLLVLLVAAVAQGMFVVLFVFFVTGVLGGTDAEVGLLRGVQAVGAIAAGVALGTGRIRTGAARLAAIGTGAFALLSLAIWNVSFLTSATGVFVVLFAAVGAPGVLMATGLLTRLQAASTDADRGRVFAIAGVVQAVGQGCGLLLAGGLQGVVGTVPLLEVQGGLYVAAAVLAAVLLPRSAARTPAGDEVQAPGGPARGPGGTPAAARAGGSA
jgi:Na+/melibiose symporter-like transporter